MKIKICAKKNVFFLLLFSSFFISGFLDANYIVKLDKDENVETTLIVKINKNNVQSKEAVKKFIHDNFYKNLEEANRYPFFQTYKLFEDEEHYIFKLSELGKNLNALHFGGHYGIFIDGSSGGGVTSINLPFYLSRNISGDVAIPESRIDGYLVQEHLKGKDIDIKVTVSSTSFIFNNHNADTVLDGGKQLIWNIDPYQANEVTFGYVVNDLYKPAIFIFAALALGLFWYKKRR